MVNNVKMINKASIKLSKITNYLYHEYCNPSRKFSIFIVGIISCVLFLLYYTCPFYADDFGYMNCWKSDIPLSNIQDIIDFQYTHYMKWGGRTVAHTILQLLLLNGKLVTAFLNTLCHMLLAYMIMKCSFTKRNIFIYIEIFGILYFLNPNFEETMMWRTGNANYMWTMLLILLTIFPFLQMLDTLNGKGRFLFPIAFLAGWTNENMAPTMILLMICCVIYLYRKKKIVNYKAIVMIVLASLGCILLIFAPGNFCRADALPSGILSLMYRGHGQVNAWCNWLLPIWVVFIIISMFIHNETSKNVTYATIGWAIMSILIMIASPSYPERATFGSFVLIVIAIQSKLKNISGEAIINRRILVDCIFFIGWLGSLASIIILAFVRSRGVYIPG